MNWFAKFLQLVGIKPIVAMEKSFSQTLVDVAMEQARLGIRESSKNHGPGIEKFWTATNYPDGYANREPYCAAFGCWIFREAIDRFFGGASGAPFRRPKSARVLDWPVWASAEDQRDVWDMLDPKTTKARAGDVVLFDFNGSASGGTHWGLVTASEHVDGSFDTVEANTNAEGSREGDGVYLKHDRTRRAVFTIIRYD